MLEPTPQESDKLKLLWIEMANNFMSLGIAGGMASTGQIDKAPPVAAVALALSYSMRNFLEAIGVNAEEFIEACRDQQPCEIKSSLMNPLLRSINEHTADPDS